MAYNKKTWKARQGLGLNKFSIDGATPVPIVNQPDSVTQQGDALSAGNLNDLEQRIADAFDDVEESEDVLQSQINQHESRLENLEQKAGDYTTVQYRGTNAVPTGKAKYGLVKSIVGKTRAWNQLVPNGNFASGDGWVLESGVTASFSGNVATISSTTSSNGIRREIDFINGHKYLVSAEINTESALAVKFGSSSSGGAQVQITTSVFNQFVKYSEIKTASADSYQFYIFVSGTYSNLKVRNVTLYDLTLIFGSGNEPSTVAEALAQLPALGQYNAYDAGSLVDTEVSGVKSVGFNIWDEQTRNGYYDNSGVFVPYATVLANKNLIPVSPATLYCIYSAYKNVDRVCFYDASENFISYASMTYSQTTNTFTTPPNCSYINFNMKVEYGDTYLGSICINVSGALDGTYKPYVAPYTLSLSDTVTLRSARSVAEVLTLETGKKTRPIGSVDMGTLDWTVIAQSDGQYNMFQSSSISSRKAGSVNLIVDRYAVSNKDKDQLNNKEIVTATTGSRRVCIRDDSFNSDADAFTSAMSGVYLYYELETPLSDEQVCDPITDNFIEVQGGGTIDTIQEQSPVIDNCLDVGYLTL